MSGDGGTGEQNDQYSYNMSNSRRGECIIINNFLFDRSTGKPIRIGSEIDEARMETLFTGLGFTVTVKHNLTGDDMKEEAKQAASRDHSASDCFAMVILSHGDEIGKIWGVDKIIELKDIFNSIKKSSTLVGKPKLFFLQACKEERLDDDSELSHEVQLDGEHPSGTKPTKIPLAADFLYAYSAPPGHPSFRNINDGGWFFQALNEVFSKHSSTMGLIQMMTRVNHMVACKSDNPNEEDKVLDKKRKQVSSFVSMLTKELIFKPKPTQTTPA